MKEKLIRFPQRYKYGFRLIGSVRNWNWFLDRVRYPKWILRPVCWFTRHEYHIYWPYGVKVKQCDRCAKQVYKKKTTERLPKIFKGEIGELYGVRFIETRGIK